jgi:tetratricopeptide (TPR) repeat protein
MPARKTSSRKISLGQRLLLILFGLVLLAGLELILRLLPVAREAPGEGDPFVGFSGLSPLFVPGHDLEGRPVLRVAPGKERWFNYQQFPARKDPGTLRIFTLGGSTTYGHPFADSTSFTGWTRALLERGPGSTGRRCEVINAGGISYASYRVVVLLKEILRCQPDLIVIYSGHNEFLEARTYENLLDTPRVLFRTREVLQRFKTYRLLSGAVKKARSALPAGKSAASAREGNTLTPEVQTMLDRSAGLEYYQRDTVFSRGVFEHFRFNVARMIELCRAAGVTVIFMDPVDNTSDFSPFKSEHRAGLDSEGRIRFSSLMFEGESRLRAGKARDAAASFGGALALDSLYAQASYELGLAWLAAGDTSAAWSSFLKARELDVCPLRAQEPIHRILREETSRAGVDLLDLPGLFRGFSPGGLIGKNLLMDHIHPTPEGNLLIAIDLLRRMSERGLLTGYRVPEMSELEGFYQTELARLSPGYFRHGIVNLGKVLLWAHKYAETYYVLQNQWAVLEPDGEAQYLMGSTLEKLGEPEEAVGYLRRALELAPDHPMALSRLAEVYAEIGQADSAKTAYEKFMKLYPDDLTALRNYSLLLGQMGQADKGLTLLIQARNRDPNLPLIDNSLGVIYSMLQRYDRAVECFEEAARKDPLEPQTFYNIGMACASMGRMDQAEKAFLEAIRRNPDFAAARTNLGNVYQGSGRTAQAEEQFRLALTMDPGQLAPYINLARLCQASGRSAEAVRLARRGLELYPGEPRLQALLGPGPGR